MDIFSNSENINYDHLKGKVIGIEGNIGVGKTTICHKIKSHLQTLGYKAKVFEEKVDGYVLEEFIENIESATPIFQLTMLEKRKEIHRDAIKESRNSGTICIIDRTLIGDYIFAQVNRKHFSDKQWVRYMNALKIDLPKPDYVVLMNAEPEICIQRMMNRDRRGEDKYDKDYIKALHDAHQKIEIDHIKIKAVNNITAKQVLQQIG